MVNKFSGMSVPVVTKKDTKENQYWKAVAQYGEDEAIHVLADMWGESTHSVKIFIDKIGDDIWL